MEVEYVLQKYPRIVAHLIAESYGYFTPRSAALALIRAKKSEPHYCEWYSHCAQSYGNMHDKENIKRVTKEVLSQAIASRHRHIGGMSNYKTAKAIVDQSTEGQNLALASWF